MAEVVGGGDLARGMTRQRQRQILPGDTGTVIPHTDQFCAALLDVDFNARGAGIQRVFQQLLDHRGRPLNDFSGGNLVGEQRGKTLNATLCRYRLHRIVAIFKH